MAVVFEHGTATRDIHDHGVEILGPEGGDVGVGEFPSRFAGARVEMNRAAAGLGCGNGDIAAVLLQHSSGRPVRLTEHDVGDTAGE